MRTSDCCAGQGVTGICWLPPSSVREGSSGSTRHTGPLAGLWRGLHAGSDHQLTWPRSLCGRDGALCALSSGGPAARALVPLHGRRQCGSVESVATSGCVVLQELLAPPHRGFGVDPWGPQRDAIIPGTLFGKSYFCRYDKVISKRENPGLSEWALHLMTSVLLRDRRRET